MHIHIYRSTKTLLTWYAVKTKKNKPAKRASSSSLLLGTMLLVDGMKVQQGQWTPNFSPRLLSDQWRGDRDQLMKMKFTNTVNDLPLLNLTWIWHPVLNGFGDLHRDPGSLRLQLNGAGINVTLSGDALFIWPQQLTRHIHRLKTWQWWSWHTDTQSPVGIVSKYLAFSVC